MNTTINKALVALIGGLIVLANAIFDMNWIADETTINSIAGVATPILVWMVPNKSA